MIILPSVSSGIISASLFKPTSISNLRLWLKADAGVTVAGGVVTAWADQSGPTQERQQVESYLNTKYAIY